MILDIKLDLEISKFDREHEIHVLELAYGK